MKAVWISAVTSLFILTSGCSAGSKCESVCEQANACEVTERPLETDCNAFCEDVPATHERMVGLGATSCDTEYQAHLSCWENSSAEMCNAEFEGCVDSADAWTACMATFCNAHSDDARCTCWKFAKDDPATEDVDESENCIDYGMTYTPF